MLNTMHIFVSPRSTRCPREARAFGQRMTNSTREGASQSVQDIPGRDVIADLYPRAGISTREFISKGLSIHFMAAMAHKRSIRVQWLDFGASTDEVMSNTNLSYSDRARTCQRVLS